MKVFVVTAQCMLQGYDLSDDDLLEEERKALQNEITEELMSNHTWRFVSATQISRDSEMAVFHLFYEEREQRKEEL